MIKIPRDLIHDIRKIEFFQIIRKKLLSGSGGLFVVNDVALFMYAMMVAEGFLHATTFRINWPNYFHECMVAGTLVVAIGKMLLTSSYNMWEKIIIPLFVGIFMIAKTISGYTLLWDVLVLILALRGISFQKILKVFFVTVAFLLTVTIIASQTGMIDNLVYYRGDRIRQSFGVCYPTDFAAFFVWLGFAWIGIRKKKLSFLEIGIFALFGIGIWKYCDARLSAGVLFLSVVVLLIIKGRGLFLKYIGKDKSLLVLKWMEGAFVFAIPICSTIIVLLSHAYSPDNELLLKLDALLTGRLALGRKAFWDYDVTMFGQFIPMIGNGGSSAAWLRKNYFFLDSGFLSVLMCYGLLVFTCIVLMFTVSAFRAYKKGDVYLLVVIVLLTLDSMVEHHIMEFWYNPFLFLFLANRKDNKVPEVYLNDAA